MSEYTDIMFKGNKTLSTIAMELYVLARAFGTTGNDNMANTLCELGTVLKETSEKMYKAVGDEINDRFKDSQNNSATILASCLAGIKIAKDSLEDK